MEFLPNEGDQIVAELGDVITVVNVKYPLISLKFEVKKLMRNAYGTKLAKGCKIPAKIRNDYFDKNGNAKNIVVQVNEVFQVN
ncbi:hypothetical protein MJH12_04810 [bacterium]|nr:hypothetical protein [bacterium]